MRFSEQTDKLIPALASIQNRVEVKKNKTNPHHKNKYADLEAVVDAISPELDGQGLMFIQTLDDENLAPGQVLVITRIVHVTSGQWLESRFRMDARAATPQDLGSAVTYARRYSLVTILGLTPEDDDGNKGSGIKQKEQASKPQLVKSQPAPVNSPIMQGILALMKQNNLSKEAVMQIAKVDTLKGLSEAQLQEVYDCIHFAMQEAN